VRTDGLSYRLILCWELYDSALFPVSHGEGEELA